MASLPPYLASLLRNPENAPLTLEREEELGEVIATAREARKLNAISNKLEREERRAKDELVRRNIQLVVNIAYKYAHRVDIEDLVGAGNVALVRAVNLWDPTVAPLTPWAIRWVRSAMTRTVDAGRSIRLPEELAYRGAILARTKGELETLLGRMPTKEELAEALDTNEAELDKLDSLPYASAILDAPLLGNPNATLGDIVKDQSDLTKGIELEDLRARLIAACSELTPQEARIVIARFDLADTGEVPSLNELGVELGFSREMVRRLEASALAKLRHPALEVTLVEFF